MRIEISIKTCIRSYRIVDSGALKQTFYHFYRFLPEREKKKTRIPSPPTCTTSTYIRNISAFFCFSSFVAAETGRIDIIVRIEYMIRFPYIWEYSADANRLHKSHIGVDSRHISFCFINFSCKTKGREAETTRPIPNTYTNAVCHLPLEPN